MKKQLERQSMKSGARLIWICGAPSKCRFRIKNLKYRVIDNSYFPKSEWYLDGCRYGGKGQPCKNKDAIEEAKKS